MPHDQPLDPTARIDQEKAGLTELGVLLGHFHQHLVADSFTGEEAFELCKVWLQCKVWRDCGSYDPIDELDDLDDLD